MSNSLGSLNRFPGEVRNEIYRHYEAVEILYLKPTFEICIKWEDFATDKYVREGNLGQEKLSKFDAFTFQRMSNVALHVDVLSEDHPENFDGERGATYKTSAHKWFKERFAHKVLPGARVKITFHDDWSRRSKKRIQASDLDFVPDCFQFRTIVIVSWGFSGAYSLRSQLKGWQIDEHCDPALRIIKAKLEPRLGPGLMERGPSNTKSRIPESRITFHPGKLSELKVGEGYANPNDE
ncbi:uncharacterized protein KY384_003530 [Bacidia gigantensis]|uniref:uncharacterized protein n=1 Tax=Bacidia gigantensis TaxID=2732470 RepID=UPI001D03C8EC|nr:uncharacterized protein KY384_003530 [Bacidia gigantensis]KAG8531894.1 hypothetical protein KY384_003530 [Bacidia gigantensis]